MRSFDLQNEARDPVVQRRRIIESSSFEHSGHLINELVNIAREGLICFQHIQQVCCPTHLFVIDDVLNGREGRRAALGLSLRVSLTRADL